MLDTDQAKAAVEKAYAGTKAEICVDYHGLFLVRVKQANSDEADYDPFFSVNPLSGEVKEFPIMLAKNPAEIARLFPPIPE